MNSRKSWRTRLLDPATSSNSTDVPEPRPWIKMPDDTEFSDSMESRSALFLFACHLEWHDNGNIAAYQELLAALDDPDEDIRIVAEVLLHRRSPRPPSWRRAGRCLVRKASQQGFFSSPLSRHTASGFWL